MVECRSLKGADFSAFQLSTAWTSGGGASSTYLPACMFVNRAGEQRGDRALIKSNAVIAMKLTAFMIN